MILGAFGDSFLFGSDLADCNFPYPSKYTWPARIATDLNLDYTCYATPGVGNRIILDNLLKAVESNGSNMLYIINWTYIDRFDYINVQTEPELWHTLRPGADDALAKIYYKSLHSERNDKLMNLTVVFSAIQVLTLQKCSFIMTCMDNLLLDSTWHCPTSVAVLQNYCSQFLKTFDGTNFISWSKKQNFAISDKMHPLEQAHQSAANYWLPTVKHILNGSKSDLTI